VSRDTARRDGGFALLIVLWSLALITLVVTQVVAAGRSETMLANNLRRAAVLRAETDEALHLAIFHLVDPASRWDADGTEHVVRLAGAVVAVRIDDEFGKINPSLAPPAVLASLLRAVGEGADRSDELAAAIVDWRYPSAEDGATGVKAQHYRAAGRDYAPPSANFQSIGELGLVLGLMPELVARLAPHLTLYTDSDPDARHADPVVARALALAGIAAPTGPMPPPRVVTITAAGVAAGGGRFVRSAVISLGPDKAGRQFRIVTWDAPSS
jgi:general secretion pathway protein K